MAGLVLKAQDVTEVNWKRYGTLYDLTGRGSTGNTNSSEGDGWEDTDTNIPILDTLGVLGMTMSTGMPFECVEMERHLHTQEAQIPASGAMVLCVAPPSEGAPLASEIVPITIRSGFVFVLHRAVWHSASHGLTGSYPYYWMARVYENEPTVWMDVAGGPIRIKA